MAEAVSEEYKPTAVLLTGGAVRESITLVFALI
jgi:hypothetical protein